MGGVFFSYAILICSILVNVNSFCFKAYGPIFGVLNMSGDFRTGLFALYQIRRGQKARKAFAVVNFFTIYIGLFIVLPSPKNAE